MCRDRTPDREGSRSRVRLGRSERIDDFGPLGLGNLKFGFRDASLVLVTSSLEATIEVNGPSVQKHLDPSDRQLAVLLADRVVQIATIRDAISFDVQLSGRFAQKDLQLHLAVLEASTLPVTLVPVKVTGAAPKPVDVGTAPEGDDLPLQDSTDTEIDDVETIGDN